MKSHIISSPAAPGTFSDDFDEPAPPADPKSSRIALPPPEYKIGQRNDSRGMYECNGGTQHWKSKVGRLMTCPARWPGLFRLEQKKPVFLRRNGTICIDTLEVTYGE